MCKYCDEDRIIEQGAIWFGKEGKIATINRYNEFIINIDGQQVNIPIKFCPFCGDKLIESSK